MEIALGRLIDHVQLPVSDLKASRRFYETVLGALGRSITREGPFYFASDELFVVEVTGEPTPAVHVAFQAASREDVAAFHRAGLAVGGRDNGAPGLRHYHPGYYAAYLLDPDGHNIEAVTHGPASRSADAVIVSPEG